MKIQVQALQINGSDLYNYAGEFPKTYSFLKLQ